jgi:hypothetical protein
MDEVRWDYYREIGFDDEKRREIGKKESLTRNLSRPHGDRPLVIALLVVG